MEVHMASTLLGNMEWNKMTSMIWIIPLVDAPLDIT